MYSCFFNILDNGSGFRQQGPTEILVDIDGVKKILDFQGQPGKPDMQVIEEELRLLGRVEPQRFGEKLNPSKRIILQEWSNKFNTYVDVGKYTSAVDGMKLKACISDLVEKPSRSLSPTQRHRDFPPIKEESGPYGRGSRDGFSCPPDRNRGPPEGFGGPGPSSRNSLPPEGFRPKPPPLMNPGMPMQPGPRGGAPPVRGPKKPSPEEEKRKEDEEIYNQYIDLCQKKVKDMTWQELVIWEEEEYRFKKKDPSK